MKKIIIYIIAVLTVICITSCNVIVTPPETTGAAETETVYPHSDMELAPLESIIATTEYQQIPVYVFKYFFMDQYSTFISNYYSYLSYYGLDLSIPLHDQAYLGSEEEGTWYGFFLERGQSAFEQYAKFAEMAKKEGITLDEDDYKKIEDNLDSIQKIADSYSMSFEEYMSDYMGEGMTRERMKAATEISQLGYKYYEKIYYEPTYTEAQIEEVYKNSNGAYSLVDYYEAYITALYDETDTDEQAEAAKTEAKTRAEKMKELLEGGMSFSEAYYTVNPEDKPKETADTTETTDTTEATETGEEESKENAMKSDEDFLYTAVEYSSDEKYEFLYKDDIKDGQVNIYYDTSGNAYVIQCVKAPYKNTSKTVDVRHILLSSVDYDSEEEAYAQAQKLLEQINAAADPKAEFIELVPQYSSDTGSKSKGGLYTEVAPGYMVEEFNDWCFDPERKVGDTGIVLTDFGYHIMYFDNFGEEIWYYSCETELRDNDFNKKAEEIYDTVKITYDDDLLDRLIK